MRYLILVEQTETGYSAYALDLPGCIAAGVAGAGLKIGHSVNRGRPLMRPIVSTSRMNLAISVVLKAAFVVAAVAGVATLWMAVLADTGASVLVIANALRLLRAD